MAIAFDAVASYAPVGNTVSTASWTHTVGAGLTNSILVICMGYFGSSTSTAATSVTYNGVAATKVRRDNDGAGAAASEIWYLLNPASGANTVSITLSSVTIVSSDLPGGSVSLSGVDQANPLDSQAGSVSVGSHSSQSDNVTTVANNCWTVDVQQSSTTSFTVSGSQTQRWNNPNTNCGTAGSTLGPISPAGVTAVGWSYSTVGNRTAHSVAAFKPAASTFVGGGLLTMGCGT